MCIKRAFSEAKEDDSDTAGVSPKCFFAQGGKEYGRLPRSKEAKDLLAAEFAATTAS